MAARLAKGISPTAVFARIAAPFERLHRRLGAGGDQFFTDLPEEARTDLARLLAPAVDRLEALRLETVARVDSMARWAIPAAALAAFVPAHFSGQGIAVSLLASAGMALAAYWGVQVRPGARYLTQARETFGREIAAYLSDFHFVPRASPDLRRIARWKLFPRVGSPLMDDYMTGTRDGRQVAMYRFGVTYRDGSRGTVTARRLTAACAEVETGHGCSGAVVMLPRWADAALRTGPAGTYGLHPVQACDGLLDPYYEVFAELPADCGHLLNPGRCARIRALADSHAARDRERVPVLVFLPGYLAALFPLPTGEPLFSPPPFWRALEPEAAVARFASDLAVKHALLMETLELGPGMQAGSGSG